MYLFFELGWDKNIERYRFEFFGLMFFVFKRFDEMYEYFFFLFGSGFIFFLGLNYIDIVGDFRKNKGWMRIVKVRNLKVYNEVCEVLLFIEEDLLEEWWMNWLEWDGKV